MAEFDRRLSALDGAAYLSSGNVGALPFTPLMGRPAGLGVESWLGRCVAATEGLEEHAAEHGDKCVCDRRGVAPVRCTQVK